MADPDYATWLTKQAAADALAVSTKTVEQMAKAGQLQQASWRRVTGGPALAVYHPGDVARLAKARHPAAAPFVLPVDVSSPNGNGHQPSSEQGIVAREQRNVAHQAAVADDPIRLLFAAALRAVTSQSSEKSLFLTLAEAAAESHLPAHELRRLIRAGTLVPFCGRSARTWRIRRRDLEAL